MTKFTAAFAALALVAGAPIAASALPAPAVVAESKFSIDTPIEQLVANPAAKAVVVKHIPGIDQHPAYDQFKAMSLRQVAPYSEGLITEAMLTAIDTELKALPAE